MSNSPLVQKTILSPNHSGRRTHKITKIAIHHAAGVIGGVSLAGVFLPKARQASSNYNLGSDGVIVLGVDEANRAWTTSSSWCDNRAVTIEVGNSTRGPQWLVSDYVLNRLIDLVTDICRRNEIYPCTYTGGKDGVLQKHEWYSNTNCPGPYLGSKFPYIAEEVNKRLRGKEQKPTSENKQLYRVQVGAYSSPQNATNMIAKIKSLGFDTYMVKVGNLYKVQTGAYSIKKNAENQMAKLKAKGLDAFITTEKGDPTNATLSKKSNSEIAKEVLLGNWGNGNERKDKLTKAGYNYTAVQSKVNEMLSSKKSIDVIIKEIIRGDWGNGEERKKKLTAAGYNYNEVQKEVNKLLR